jgi:hypothetical protein
MMLLLIVLGVILVLAASFLMKKSRGESFASATASFGKAGGKEGFTTTKGLPMPDWAWNPKTDTTYAKKQETQCLSGGGKITKYSDAFWMCNGAKWS